MRIVLPLIVGLMLVSAAGCGEQPGAPQTVFNLEVPRVLFAATCAEVFDLWDLDGDAIWTLEEFRAGHKELGRWSRAEQDALFARLAPKGRLARVEALTRCEELERVSHKANVAPPIAPSPPPTCENMLAAHDADADGGLNLAELGAFLSSRGGSPAGAAELLRGADADGDGRVRPAEYCKGLTPVAAAPAVAPSPITCQTLFAQLDRSGNREVSLSEFLSGVDYARFANITPEAVFRAADTDQTGTLSASEVCSEVDAEGRFVGFFPPEASSEPSAGP